MKMYIALDDQVPYCKDMETSVSVIYRETLWINIYRFFLDRDIMNRDNFTSLKYSMNKLNAERQ